MLTLYSLYMAHFSSLGGLSSIRFFRFWNDRQNHPNGSAERHQVRLHGQEGGEGKRQLPHGKPKRLHSMLRDRANRHSGLERFQKTANTKRQQGRRLQNANPQVLNQLTTGDGTDPARTTSTPPPVRTITSEHFKKTSNH